MASSVVGAIEPRLRLSEIERATYKQTEKLDAYDLYLHALAQFNKYSPEGMRAAIPLLKQALASDPSYASAAAMFGFCRALQKGLSWEPLSAADIAEAVNLINQTLEAGKDDPDALWMAGDAISILAREHARAAVAIDRALKLNPNAAHAWMARGWVSCCQHEPWPAIEALKRAVRLSPLDPLGYFFSGGLALAQLIAGQYEDALETADACSREYPRYTTALRIKVVCCAQLGHIGEAQEGVKKLIALNPQLTIARFKENLTEYYSPLTVEIFVDGFRKAGLPES